MSHYKRRVYPDTIGKNSSYDVLHQSVNIHLDAEKSLLKAISSHNGLSTKVAVDFIHYFHENEVQDIGSKVVDILEKLRSAHLLEQKEGLWYVSDRGQVS